MQINKPALVFVLLLTAFTFMLSGCASMVIAKTNPGTAEGQTSAYGGNSTASENDPYGLKALGLGGFLPSSTPVLPSVRTYSNSGTTKPGQVSITGNKDFFSDGSSDFFIKDKSNVD